MVFEADIKSKNKINLTASMSAHTQNENLAILIKELNNIQMSGKFE